MATWIAFAVLGAVAAAVLWVPVKVEVSVQKAAESPAVHVGVRCRWLVFSMRSDGAARRARKRQARARLSSGRWARHGLSRLRAAWQSPGFVRRCLRFLGDLARLARPDRVSIHARVGFDDPADTGVFLGWLGASRGFAGTFARDTVIDIAPDFDGARIEGRADLVWSRSLAALLRPLVMFLLSPAVWRAAWRVRHA